MHPYKKAPRIVDMFCVDKILLVAILIFFVSCDFRKPANSMQELNFEVFWQTFEDNYAFFNLKNVNWHNTYKTHRDRVNANTTDDELFKILGDMVRPLEDAHIHIEANDENYFNEGRPSRFRKEFSNDSLIVEFWEMVHQTLYNNGFETLDSAGYEYEGQKLFHFTVSDKYGYLRFLRCIDIGEEYTADEVIQMRKDLNPIFEKFQDLKGIIIDVRLNRGGYAHFGYDLAARFTESKTLGHYENYRVSKGGYEEFDSLKAYYINPDQHYSKYKFLDEVMILTNDQVGSAAEVFVLIMKELPNVTTVGENTAGIFSHMYEFNLPNNWWVSLSNQRIYSADMEVYEDVGIPVDIEVMNSLVDLENRQDPLVIEALNQLNKNVSNKR